MPRFLRTVELSNDIFFNIGMFAVNTLRNVCYVPAFEVEPYWQKGPLAIINTILGEPALKRIHYSPDDNIFINAVHCIYGKDLMFNGYYPKSFESGTPDFVGKISYATTSGSDFENEVTVSLPDALGKNMIIYTISSDRINHEVYCSYSKTTGENGIIVIDELTKTYYRNIQLKDTYIKLSSTGLQTMYAVPRSVRKTVVLIDTKTDEVEKNISIPDVVDNVAIKYVGDVCSDVKNSTTYIAAGDDSINSPNNFIILKYDSATGEYIGSLKNSLIENDLAGCIVVDEAKQRLYISGVKNVVYSYDLKQSALLEPIVLPFKSPTENVASMMMNFNANRLILTTEDINQNDGAQPCKVFTVTDL